MPLADLIGPGVNGWITVEVVEIGLDAALERAVAAHDGFRLSVSRRKPKSSGISEIMFRYDGRPLRPAKANNGETVP